MPAHVKRMRNRVDARVHFYFLSEDAHKRQMREAKEQREREEREKEQAQANAQK